MSIIQPLYYAAGSYQAMDDRRMLASLIGSEADGTRVVGVIGSNILGSGCMKVAYTSGLSLTVQPGLCVIADSVNQDFQSPSLYLAGIDSSEYTITLSGPASGSRTDLIYAKFDDTPYHVTTASRSGTTVTLTTDLSHGFSVGDTVSVAGLGDVFDGNYVATLGTTGTTVVYETSTSGTIDTTYFYATATLRDTQDSAAGSATPITIINRSFALDSNSSVGTATITTESAHGLLVGDTVKISGLGAFFDGIYTTYTGTTGSTMTYRKSGANIAALGSSGAIQNFFAVVRAPFTIKQAQNTTELPSVIGVPLAEVVVTSGSVTSVVDRRNFVSANGGVQLYDSLTGSAPNHAKGKIAYDVYANNIYYSDGTTWNQFAISTHVHVDDNRYQDAVTSAASTLAFPVSEGNSGFATVTGSSYTLPRALSPSVSFTFTTVNKCYALVQYSVYVTAATTNDVLQVDVELTGATTSGAMYAVYDSAPTSNAVYSEDGTAMGFNDQLLYDNTALGTSVATLHGSKLYAFESGTTTATLFVAISNTTDSFTVSEASLRVIPLYDF